jgi:hypothetical protein
LGYGAWGVTYSIALCFIVGGFLERKIPFALIVLFVTVAYLPSFIVGSRIDYVSLMVVMFAYSVLFTGNKQAPGYLISFLIVVITLVVGLIIGFIRYHGFIFPESLEYLTPITQHSDSTMLYLSTYGDVGASFFQIIGLLRSEVISPVQFDSALYEYLERLLPGSFFPDRPIDLATLLPENIGGGALHSVGEGYLIGGPAGSGLVGLFFGFLGSISLLSVRMLAIKFTPVIFVFFAFPWLILIRGGWYQLFATIKSIQILAFFLILLSTIQWLRARPQSGTV